MVNTQVSPTSKISSPEQAFMMDLCRGYDSEQQYLSALRECERQISNQNLKNVVQMHIEQTQEQIQCLERIFQMMGQQPQAIPCESARCLVSEGKQMVEKIDNPVLKDAAICAGQAKVEAIEIASYNALIVAAQQKGQPELVNMLMKSSLQEQKAAAGYGLCLVELSKQIASSKNN